MDSAAAPPRARHSASARSASRDDLDRTRRALRRLIDLSAMTQREARKRLVAHSSNLDLRRLLSGRLALKLHHVLALTRVLGIHPLEFFRIVFREPEQPSPLLRGLDNLITPHPRAPAAPPRSDIEELRRYLGQLERDIAQLQSDLQPVSQGRSRLDRSLQLPASPPPVPRGNETTASRRGGDEHFRP